VRLIGYLKRNLKRKFHNFSFT